MDHVLDAKFSPHAICLVNYCHLYLQAVTLSDIANATGSCLDPSFLEGELLPLSSNTQWHHINQAWLSPEAWHYWWKACLLWSKPDSSLHQPLGAWLHPHTTQHHIWPPYYVPHTQHLFIRNANVSTFDHPVCQSTAHYMPNLGHLNMPIPSTAVHITDSDFGWQITGFIFTIHCLLPSPIPSLFLDYLCSHGRIAFDWW
jgi:hypothetical protein